MIVAPAGSGGHGYSRKGLACFVKHEGFEPEVTCLGLGGGGLPQGGVNDGVGDSRVRLCAGSCAHRSFTAWVDRGCQGGGRSSVLDPVYVSCVSSEDRSSRLGNGGHLQQLAEAKTTGESEEDCEDRGTGGRGHRESYLSGLGPGEWARLQHSSFHSLGNSSSRTGRPSAADRSAANMTRWVSMAVSRLVRGMGLPARVLSVKAWNWGW